jgi:WD40 repeat protein/DNA-binding SARP family transcriptional activator
MVKFGILGPIELTDGERQLAVGGPRQVALLAFLLLHPNRAVSADQLLDAVWGADAGRAVKRLHTSVARLRKTLDTDGSNGGPTLKTVIGGYMLTVEPGQLDADVFQAGVEDGRRALDEGEAARAAGVLRDALGLWRGPALAEVAYEAFAQGEIRRLEELRLAALEARIEADLQLGRHARVIGELEALVASHPAREQLVGQLMVALYRSGRQSEALEAYSRARQALISEIGVEPGPQLRRLHEAVLRQDASLEAQPATPPLPPELDPASAPSLVGRGSELERLSAAWARAKSGDGALLALLGESGIGKSRLAAELAREAHEAGATVLYTTARDAPDAVYVALDKARAAGSATLLVVDHADMAPAEVLAALVELGQIAADRPLLVLALGDDRQPDEGPLVDLASESSLALAPLDLEAVHAIAARYVPGRRSADVPAAELLRTSRGVPSRVHSLARQWARHDAAIRVKAGADRAAAGRLELRSVESTLAEDVVEFEVASQVAVPEAESDAPVVCPFKGLASFEMADAPYFFGRERLVAELVARLVGAPLLGIVGPSGSGKSSVLRAGLLPALASGVLPGSERRRQVLIRPGAHPLAELHSSLADVGDEAVVLAVDQFEEVFTVCADEEERAAFIEELAREAAGVRDTVLLAVRADQYGRCATYPELSSLLAANHVLAGPMVADDLRRAVECPAQRVGLYVDPELVDALVKDVQGEPGALPLLSTALLELWQRREGRRLRHASYERTGGVRGAVARLGEHAFGQLTDEQQRLARRIFLRLTSIDDESNVERRPAPLEELTGEGGEGIAQVVALLADSRLLTVNEGTLEPAHEALLREWPRLRGWIEEDRDGLRIERQLEIAAREWRRVKRDEGALYRGARLVEAAELAERRQIELTDAEHEFLDASLARRRRDRMVRRRWLTIAFGTLFVALVAIAVVAAVAVHQKNAAQHQRDLALSRQLAAQSDNEIGVDPELALRLALSAVDKWPTPDASAALRQATLAFRQVAVLRADSVTADTAAFSPDGSRVITGGDNGIVRVWDASTGHNIARLAAVHGKVLAARYGSQGRRVALGFSDGALVLTNGLLGGSYEALRVPGASIQSIAFSRDGRRLAAALSDGTIRVVGADGSRPTQIMHGHRGPVLGVDVNSDGSRLVSAGQDGTVRLWDANTGQGRILYTGAKRETAVRFSPDGSLVLAVGFDGLYRLWNAGTGAIVRSEAVSDRQLTTAAFSSDGSRFAVGGIDGAIRVWNVMGGPPVAVVRGQSSRVFDVGFGPGDRVVSAGDDGTVRIWDIGSTQSWVEPAEPDTIDFSPDGRFLVSAAEDGTVRIRDAATGRLLKSLPGPAGFTIARFSPAADELVIARSARSDVLTWSLPGGTPTLVAQLPDGRGINAARFDSTGRRIVYADGKGGITVKGVRSDHSVSLGGAPKDVWDVQVAPDGEHVAAATAIGKLLIWRLSQPARPEVVLTGHNGDINALAYSPDGRIVTAGSDRTARIWNPATRKQVVLRGHHDELTTAIFVSNGARVLSASSDGTLRLWDSGRGDALAVLQSGKSPVFDVAASRDGRIATADEAGVVRVFGCEVCGTLDQVRTLARARAARSLTPQERQRFFGGGR